MTKLWSIDIELSHVTKKSTIMTSSSTTVLYRSCFYMFFTFLRVFTRVLQHCIWNEMWADSKHNNFAASSYRRWRQNPELKLLLNEKLDYRSQLGNYRTMSTWTVVLEMWKMKWSIISYSKSIRSTFAFCRCNFLSLYIMRRAIFYIIE